MGSVERRAREREERRRRILGAARDLFVEEGYANVSMRKIAGRVEYSPMALYQYFPTKERLLATLCQETFERLTAQLEQLEAKPGGALEKLKKGLRLYVDFGIAHPNDYQVTFMLPKPKLEAEVETTGEHAFDTLRRAVSRCAHEGLFSTGIEETSEALWAAIHGVTALFITQTNSLSTRRKRLIGLVIDSMVAGLSSPPAST